MFVWYWSNQGIYGCTIEPEKMDMAGGEYPSECCMMIPPIGWDMS